MSNGSGNPSNGFNPFKRNYPFKRIQFRQFKRIRLEISPESAWHELITLKTSNKQCRSNGSVPLDKIIKGNGIRQSNINGPSNGLIPSNGFQFRQTDYIDNSVPLDKIVKGNGIPSNGINGWLIPSNGINLSNGLHCYFDGSETFRQTD